MFASSIDTLPKGFTHEEFIRAYKEVLMEQARWPNVINGFYQNRQLIDKDLRVARTANELHIKGMPLHDALSTSRLMPSYDEQINICQCDRMPRDD